jgi:hypothetical protein
LQDATCKQLTKLASPAPPFPSTDKQKRRRVRTHTCAGAEERAGRRGLVIAGGVGDTNRDAKSKGMDGKPQLLPAEDYYVV